MRARYSEETKAGVLALGASGKTYREIQSLYPVPKSTLSHWFKHAGHFHDRSRQLTHLKKARAAALVTIRRQKQERIENAARAALKAAESTPLQNISVAKSLLAMLYWAEGTKSDRSSGATFVNTDPELLRLYTSLLRSSFALDESRFRVRLHLHNYHKPLLTLRFWSHLLEIPESQFGKIYVKKRSTRRSFRRNFRGICTVVYHDSSVRRELLALGRSLAQKLSSFNG